MTTLLLDIWATFLTVELLKLSFLLNVVLSLVGVTVMDPSAFNMLANYR